MFTIDSINIRRYIVLYIIKNPTNDFNGLALNILAETQKRFFIDEDVLLLEGFVKPDDKYKVIQQSNKEVMIQKSIRENSENREEIIIKVSPSKVIRVNEIQLRDIENFLKKITKLTSLGLILIPDTITKISNFKFLPIRASPGSDGKGKRLLDRGEDDNLYYIGDFKTDLNVKKKKTAIPEKEKFDITNLNLFTIKNFNEGGGFDVRRILKIYTFLNSTRFHIKKVLNDKMFEKVGGDEIDEGKSYKIEEKCIFNNFTLEDLGKVFSSESISNNFIFSLFYILCNYIMSDMNTRPKYWEYNGATILRNILLLPSSVVNNKEKCSDEDDEVIKFGNTWTLKNFKQQVVTFIKATASMLNTPRILEFIECFTTNLSTTSSSQSYYDGLSLISSRIAFIEILINMSTLTESFRLFIMESNGSKKNKDSYNKSFTNISKGAIMYKSKMLSVLQVDKEIIVQYENLFYKLNNEQLKLLHEGLCSKYHSEKFLKSNLNEYTADIHGNVNMKL